MNETNTQESYQQGYCYGQRYRKLHPPDSNMSVLPTYMAGIHAIAHLKVHSPDGRHQFIQGFMEGYHHAAS